MSPENQTHSPRAEQFPTWTVLICLGSCWKISENLPDIFSRRHWNIQITLKLVGVRNLNDFGDMSLHVSWILSTFFNTKVLYAEGWTPVANTLWRLLRIWDLWKVAANEAMLRNTNIPNTLLITASGLFNYVAEGGYCVSPSYKSASIL